jgi:hypothetical protein
VGSTSTTATSPAALATSTTWPKFQCLSPDELAEKRKKGECYFCPEKFTQDHNCSMRRVYVMELDDQEDLEIIAEDLGISLHVLTGLSRASTMQLLLTIAGTTLRALVDSGSTHTFIHDGGTPLRLGDYTQARSFGLRGQRGAQAELLCMQRHDARHSRRNISG